MENRNLEFKRNNGVYYTPVCLADFFAELFLDGRGIETVFDPAYGDGALLLSVENVLKNKKLGNVKINLYGCDTNPVNGLLSHLPKANLRQQSFFDYRINFKFDLILTNPPYIRHQNIDKKWLLNLRRDNDIYGFIKNQSDLWVYFLVKSVTHLKQGGSIGAILPWSLLQAEYAQPIRKWLFEHFAEISVLALNGEYFELAQERIVLLSLKSHGKPMSSVKVCFAQDIKENIIYNAISEKDWMSSVVTGVKCSDIDRITGALKDKYGFSNLGSFANVQIGIVTGANKYFIGHKGDLKREFNICDENLVPIITSAKEFPHVLKYGISSLKHLVHLKKEDKRKFRKYIKSGLADQIQDRSHSQRRRHWYAIVPGKVPDAFFPYRMSNTPYMLLNTANVQSNNSIHRIYFHKCSKTEMKWIVVSILSIYGQFSINLIAKTYGRGILKVEPGALKSCLVLKRRDKSIVPVYNKLIRMLASNKKEEAVKLASEFIENELQISKNLKLLTHRSLEQISASRKRAE